MTDLNKKHSKGFFFFQGDYTAQRKAMGLKIDEIIGRISNSYLVTEVLGNPIWTALVIVGVMLLIVYCVISDYYTLLREGELDGEEMEELPGFWRLLFRSGVYLLIAVSGLLFFHYKALSSEFEKKLDENSLSRVVEGATAELGKVKGEGEVTLPPPLPVPVIAKPQEPSQEGEKPVIKGAPALTTAENLVFVSH